MILINLLPHREEKRRLRKRAFIATLGLSALAGVGIVAVWYTALQQMTSSQVERNEFLKAKIAVLDKEIKDIATLRSDIEALKARQKAVEDLQTDRNTPVYLLNELVRQTPEGIYLTSIRQTGETVAISGVAQTNERVSEFLRNTLYNSPWLDRPELIEIKARTPAPNSRDPARLFDFSMRVTLKRPQSPAAAASAPAKAASAAAAVKSS